MAESIPMLGLATSAVVLLMAFAIWLQGRGLARRVGALRSRQAELDERLERALEAETRAVPPEFEPLRAAQEAQVEASRGMETIVRDLERRISRHEIALESFAGMLEDQHALLERIDQRSRIIASQLEAGPPSGASSVREGGGSVEEIVREFLGREGYGEIELGLGESTEGGWRVPVRCLRGSDLRAGWVLVAQGRVVDSRLTVPTSLYP